MMILIKSTGMWTWTRKLNEKEKEKKVNDACLILFVAGDKRKRGEEPLSHAITANEQRGMHTSRDIFDPPWFKSKTAPREAQVLE